MGIVAVGTNGTVMNNEAKILYAGIFAMIAKSTVHSENFNFHYACIFRYDSEKLVFFAMIAKSLYFSL